MDLEQAIRTRRTHRSSRGYLLRSSSAVQGALVAGALIAALAFTEPFQSSVRYGLTAVLAAAMGIQNAAAQRLAVPELTTTVLTRTLTGLASESRLVGGPGSQLGRRILAVAAMLLGALAGALLALRVSVAAALGAAGAIALGVAIAAHLVSRAQADAPWIRP